MTLKVSFTGHSLGGALASLAAIRTVLDGVRNSNQIKLITFGQPRTGDTTYAFNHDRLVPYSYRLVNEKVSQRCHSITAFRIHSRIWYHIYRHARIIRRGQHAIRMSLNTTIIMVSRYGIHMEVFVIV